MESLFARSTPKRGRVCIMLGASLLLHGGLVGIAEMWTPPPPPERSVDPWWIDPPEPGGDPVLPRGAVDTPEASTPTPPSVEDTLPTPVPAEAEPEIYEPTQTPVPHRVARQKLSTTVHNNHGPVSQNAGPNSTAGGVADGIGELPTNGLVAVWVTPHPPYPPSMMMRSSSTTSTTVHITTDANGRISNVVITKSAGNSALDSYTETYVRTHWRGPANASRNTEFVYQRR